MGRLLAIAYMMHKGENIFAMGICIGVVLRGGFLGLVAYYKWKRRWLERMRDRSVDI